MQPRKLSAHEALVLAASDLRPDASIRLLQDITELPEHVVRYTLRKLLSERIVTLVPFIDVHKLGFSCADLFITLKGENQKEICALENFLLSSPEVVWIGRFLGAYQVGVGLCVAHPARIRELIAELNKRFSNLIFEQIVSLQQAASVLPRRYEEGSIPPPHSLRTTYETRREAIDQIDHRLLQLISSFPEKSNRTLATMVDISPTSVDVRLRELRRRGILIGNIMARNSRLLGLSEHKLILQLRGAHPELSEEIYEFSRAYPEVTHLIECLGGWDYELGVEAREDAGIDAVIQALYRRFGNIIRAITTLKKTSDLKQRWYPGPLQPGDSHDRKPITACG